MTKTLVGELSAQESLEIRIKLTIYVCIRASYQNSQTLNNIQQHLRSVKLLLSNLQKNRLTRLLK